MLAVKNIIIRLKIDYIYIYIYIYIYLVTVCVDEASGVSRDSFFSEIIIRVILIKYKVISCYSHLFLNNRNILFEQMDLGFIFISWKTKGFVKRRGYSFTEV